MRNFFIHQSCGYTISNDPIAFEISAKQESTVVEVVCSNHPVKGKVTIEKLGEQFTGAERRETEAGIFYQPVYELQGLQGVTFDLVAAEDIVTGDGTIRYEKGTVVDTLTTGEEGQVTSKELFLGNYQLVEKQTIPGFLLSTQVYPVTLTYADQNTAVVTTSERIENDRQRAKVSLYKAIETVESQTYNPYEEITFGLFAREDIMTVSGEVGITKDSLLELFGVTEAGDGEITTDLPVGSYYVKEISTGQSYVLGETEYNFEFQNMGNDVAYIPIHLNDGKPVNNQLMRGGLEIKKTSEDKKVAGISFKITGKTDIGTTYEKVFKTDKKGKIAVENLLPGTYSIVEVINDVTVGYLTQKEQTITVKHGETTKVSFENTLIRGGFSLLKTDEQEHALKGVTFGLYSAENNKLLKKFQTDKNGSFKMTGLLYGDYYVKELKALDGYVKNEESYGFTIQKDEQMIEIKVVNKKVPKESETPKSEDASKAGGSPKTGDTTKIGVLLALLGISVVGISASVYWKQRKKKLLK